MTTESETGWAQNQHVVQYIFPEPGGDAENVPRDGKTAVTGAWPQLEKRVTESEWRNPA